MPLASGTTLGPYTIEAPLGAGGMGEVYRARDTRLDRTVAIKVLPEHVAADPDLKQRFEREAKTISSLNHPHICTLYDIGNQDGIDFLVMEYLDGETLAQRLEKGALPLDQALQIAIEIADALDKAHRQGIVHRDLKPGNIMLTKAGAKLLDFGLAKPTAMAMGADSAMPTMTEGLTAQGAILGTLQYMAPEQLEGDDVDARTDIFAFGSVVYEMVTGERAFSGKSQASLITAIMSATPPPLAEAQPLSPPLLDRVVRKCFAKKPDERWQTTQDLRDELRWVSEPVEGAEPEPRTGQGRRVAWVAVGMAVLSAAVLMNLFRTTESQTPQPTYRYQVSPGGANLGLFGTAATSGGLTVSPDGHHFLFVATDSSGEPQLWIQPLDQLSARPLEGTEGARSPFWSADSNSVAFFAQDRLKSVAISTSTIRELGPTSIRGTSAGGSWSADGTILFHTVEGLSRISASGGAPTSLTLIDPERGALAHRWPAFLPDGRRFIFLVITDSHATRGLYMASLDSPEPEFLIASDSSGVYAEPGFLLFVRGGVLFAQPFDAERGELSGEPVPVANDVPFTQSIRRAEFAVSDTGVLMYGAGATRRLAWFRPIRDLSWRV